MKMSDDPRLLFEVARLYYQKDMSKAEIASRMGVSNTQVARLLKEAHDRKIVTVKFSPPVLDDLGAELMRRFSLRRVIVVPSTGEAEYASQRRIWGEAAADYFEENVRPGMKVGLSGGNTVYEMIAALPDRKRGIQIFPTAIIGRGPNIEHLDPLVLVTLLWAKSGKSPADDDDPGLAYYVTVPPYENVTRDDFPKEYLKLLNREKVRKVHDGMKEIDIMFGSIGAVEIDEKYQRHTHHTTIKLLEEIGVSKTQLKKEGAIGDLNYSFFDKDGQSNPRWDFFLTLGLDHLRMMTAHPAKQVVVIAGRYKLDALRAVLKGKLCNILITDELTARELKASSEFTRL